MHPPLRRLYRCGPFLLDPENRVLEREGKRIPLPPKAFETLLLLIEQRGALLEKERLLKAVWPDTFVEENNLTQYISLLRKVLGDDTGQQQYIETVPKLGYRFVAPVSEEEIGEQGAEGAAAAARPQVSALAVQKRFAGAKIAAVLLALVVVTAGLYWNASRSAKAMARDGKPRTLAVLPFRNLKQDAGTEYLSVALADSLINRLGHVSELVVRPSAYSAKYDKQDADPREAARDLRVQTLLTGSYVKEGEDLRVAAELIDAQSGEMLWHDTIDLKYDNLLAVQDALAEGVIRSLNLKLLPLEADRMRRDVPRNPLAYEYFLRGQDLSVRNDYRTSLQMLEKSVELDPSYAPAWTALGLTYNSYALTRGGGSEYSEKAQEAFARAMALNPDQPPIQILNAVVLTETGKAEQAIPLLREVLRTHPNHPLAKWWLSYAYRYGGALPESLREGEEAMELDPAVAEIATFNTYLYLGQPQKFLDSISKVDDKNVPYYYQRGAPQGENARTTFYRGLAYYYLGKFPEAGAEFDRAYEIEDVSHTRIGLALKYAITGDRQKGIDVLNKMAPETDGEVLYKIAQAYAVLGNKSSSLQAFQRSVDQNFFCYSYFQQDPLLENIRGEPEFAQVLAQSRRKHDDFQRKFF
jgi:DNA-binding winged helix-turn-helix (wHTH) protein/TolB-like protein/Tfp pilus assembly protein PilF